MQEEWKLMEFDENFDLAVLNDPDKRKIYDIYGHKGLQASWEVNSFNFI